VRESCGVGTDVREHVPVGDRDEEPLPTRRCDREAVGGVELARGQTQGGEELGPLGRRRHASAHHALVEPGLDEPVVRPDPAGRLGVPVGEAEQAAEAGHRSRRGEDGDGGHRAVAAAG
jgi:hypothetical protein